MEPITYIKRKVDYLETYLSDIKEELGRLEGNNFKPASEPIVDKSSKLAENAEVDIKRLISDEAYRIRTAIKLMKKPSMRGLADMLNVSERNLYRKMRKNKIDFKEEKWNR